MTVEADRAGGWLQSTFLAARLLRRGPMSSAEVTVDTLIVGAGLIGSSVAMHLADLSGSGQDIRVIDFDLEGSLSSSELNAGGVRATWNQPINIEMARRTIDYFANHAEQVGYRACGYLWLHGAERLSAALEARERQVKMGWPVEAWDISELRRRVPLIDKTDDLAGAIFSPRDGLVNSNRVKNHFRENARARGVVFDDRTLLRRAEFQQGICHLEMEKYPAELSDEDRRAVLGPAGSAPVISQPVRYRAKRVVNCAGAWAARIAEILGYRSPSFAVRRQLSLFDCRDVDLTQYGMIVDSSGVYFHPEATYGMAGFANNDEPPGFRYDYDGDAFFMEVIWPALHERATAFEKLRHLTGWAGLYEVSPDESAILGPVVAKEVSERGGADRIFEAHSFSGHGVMHSFSAGLALAERMIHGKYLTIDATQLGGDRFDAGRLIQETLVI